MYVRFTATARRELIEAADFYDQQRAGLGQESFFAVQGFVGRLIDNPALGRPIQGQRRALVMDRFPYRLIYGLDDVGIRIIAVSHQKRRPGYWRQRVEEPTPIYRILRLAA